jgi:citronellyl-CoA synthetase
MWFPGWNFRWRLPYKPVECNGLLDNQENGSMSVKEIRETLAELPTLLQMAKELKPRPMSTADCFAARMQAISEQFPEHTAVIFEGQTLCWRELNEQANRYAGAFRSLGLVRGDAVSLMMENRVEFLVNIIALNKLGVTAALLNTNLTGKPLIHCMSITDCKMCIFGEERLAAIDEVRTDAGLQGLQKFLFVEDSKSMPCPDWAVDLAQHAQAESAANPPELDDVILGDIAFYIFTSGTTGLPKASVLSNRRYLIMTLMSYIGGLKCDENDCIYLCLPLYHGTGLALGAGAAFSSGASMFIRRKFSASNFLREVREHGATCFIYIGELCRYLLNAPAQPGDSDNPLTTMMGNGLRPDVWHEFKQRFGIHRVAEFYGASEGNIGFMNLLNKDCTVGTTSLPAALVKYDVDADEIVRDSRGRCIRVAKGEPGLLLGKISKLTEFEGYTDAAATEKKVLRNAFRKGDAWFNSGDLMKTVDVGFAMGMAHYQFVDRVGDTFRWKSENVSTNEVGEIINSHPQVAFCNVYGVEVPRADGRAGMAAVVLAENVTELDLDSFSNYINSQLPSYSRPVFIRILPEMDTTGTFKMVKGDLRKQAYDPEQVEDALLIMKPGSSAYQPLTPALAATVRAGEAGF